MKVRDFFVSAILKTLLLIHVAAPLAAENQHGKISEQLKTVVLSSTKLSWGIALTGKVISPPLPTQSGFIAMSEGNLLTAFTQTGKILWQRDFPAKIKPLISNGHSGMLYLVTGDRSISMLRPDGTTVWTSDAGFSITGKPFAARDGRVYVFGTDNAACFGTKGTRRWTAKIPGLSEKIAPVELNDGTLVLFHGQATVDGNTSMTTLTPFGERGPTYELPGLVSDAATTDYGVLVGFSDGTAILMTESDGNIYFDWMMDTKGDGPVKTISSPGSESAALLSGDRAINLDIRTGKILSQFQIFCPIDSAVYIGTNIMGLVVSDGSMAVCYTETGDEEWISMMDQKKKWTQMCATDDGHLFFCTDRWTIESYRIKQIPTTPETSSFSPPSFGSYENLYGKANTETKKTYRGLFSGDQISKVRNSFNAGDFGADEKNWLALLTREMDSLESAWSQIISQNQTEKSYLASDMDYASGLLDIAAASQTELFQKTVALLIHGTTDTGRMAALVKTAGTMAFDPGYLMMTEMERVVQKYNKADTILAMICDATVEICRFMGRDAFNAKGRSILSMMLGNKYSLSTRSAALDSLEKLRKIFS